MQVALLFFGSELYRQQCGGSLVGTRYVITAAHCTARLSPGDLKIRVGDTNLAEEFEALAFTVDVKTIIQHPDFNNRTLQNDIAILEMSDSIALDIYPHIKPACLPDAGATFPGAATVTGWGTVASGSFQNSWLHEADLTVFPDGDCGVMNSVMTEDMMCAGLKEGGKDSCQGDSGGPLVAVDPANYHALSLVGVVSWGRGCGDPRYLGVYAEVSHFSHWLRETVKVEENKMSVNFHSVP